MEATTNGGTETSGWVRLALEGDEAAFTRIVTANHRDMRQVCYVICGDLDLADEAVQEGWAVAWRKLGSLREPERLRPWLVSIAANQARDLVRNRQRHPVVELAVAEDRDPGGDPSVRTADIDLRNALARLKPDDRALLALRYVAGLDSFELARATGMSPSGVRTRLGRLLASLRSELRDG
jgi:RNA polymerase sigma factor (sigma-70 family)